MANLILADGTTFEGESFGASVDTDGEVVFNTGMVGYPESLTDPSYRGQILVFTYPLIGNYGVPSQDLNEWEFSENFESEAIHVRAVIVAQESRFFSHHAAVGSFHDWLVHHNIPGITGVDTRALTKKLRETGVMLGRITQAGENHESQVQNPQSQEPNPKHNIDDPNLINLVAEVSCKDVKVYEPSEKNSQEKQLTVVAYDCGMKRNIIRSFLKRGVRVVRVPWNFDLSSYRDHYDGVFCSNGPGDPKICKETIKSLAWSISENVPTFGICLGNQLMALAIGGDTYKLKYGHRGANQPCVEEECGLRDSDFGKVSVRSPSADSRSPNRCIITSQNHGFAVNENLPDEWHVWFRNANDQTVEGIRHASGRFFAVQFHPEATPGPEDANYLFDEFVEVMRGHPHP